MENETMTMMMGLQKFIFLKWVVFSKRSSIFFTWQIDNIVHYSPILWLLAKCFWSCCCSAWWWAARGVSGVCWSVKPSWWAECEWDTMIPFWLLLLLLLINGPPLDEFIWLLLLLLLALLMLLFIDDIKLCADCDESTAEELFDIILVGEFIRTVEFVGLVSVLLWSSIMSAIKIKLV